MTTDDRALKALRMTYARYLDGPGPAGYWAWWTLRRHLRLLAWVVAGGVVTEARVWTERQPPNSAGAPSEKPGGIR